MENKNLRGLVLLLTFGIFFYGTHTWMQKKMEARAMEISGGKAVIFVSMSQS